MKLESLLSTLWVLGGTTLAVRLMTQNVESALAAALVEWSSRRIKALRERRDRRSARLAGIEPKHK